MKKKLKLYKLMYIPIVLALLIRLLGLPIPFFTAFVARFTLNNYLKGNIKSLDYDFKNAVYITYNKGNELHYSINSGTYMMKR